VLEEMRSEGEQVLAEERIPPLQRRYGVRFDCRYVKQYHEVSFDVPWQAIERRDIAFIGCIFHAEHNRLYGYSMEAEATPIELINMRLQAVAAADQRGHSEEPYHCSSAAHAAKGRRRMYIPEEDAFQSVQTHDGHRLRHGNQIEGPALIETVTTAVFISASYDSVVDRYGSFVLYRKGREDLVRSLLKREEAEATA
jgi:N-methylhydantoinase A